MDITHRENFSKLFLQLNLLIGSNLIEGQVSLYNKNKK
jgi:hypothetical protein